MMDFLRKHTRTIFLITIIGFLAGAFIGFGGYLFGTRAPTDAVLVINGKGVPYLRYANLLNRAVENLRQNKQDVTEETLNQKKQEVLQGLIQEEVLSEQAKKYGIKVTDAELAAAIQRYPAFQRDGRFDQAAYFQVLYQMLHTTPKEFEESQRKQIAISKLRFLLTMSVLISEPELRFEYARANGGKMTNFEKDREKFSDKLRQEKVMLAFNEWYKNLNQTVKIKVNLQNFEQKNS